MSFLKSVFWIFLAGNFASFGNFLYNLAMGRMLSPADYGELEAILSLSVLFAVPLSVLSTFIVKIVSSYWGQNKKIEIKTFLAVYRRRFLLISIVGSILLLFFSPIIIRFLNLGSILSVIFLSLLFLLSGLTIVNNGGLGGTLSFGFLAINGITGTTIKLITSVILVFLNFQLSGAFLGPLLGTLVAFALSFIELRNIFKNVKETKKIPKDILKETFFPTLFASLAITLFLTVDVILARHFFSESVSGEFAAVAVLGKIIYYAIGPVISVMFPLISARAANGTSHVLPLLGSLAMVFGVGSLIGFIFIMFPVFILNTLFDGKYLNGASYLGTYSLFMTIFSINSVLTHFLLAISYFRPMWLLFCLSAFAGILMILFHGSISQLIWINVSVSFLYFVVVSTLVCRHINFRSLFLSTVRQKPLSGI